MEDPAHVAARELNVPQPETPLGGACVEVEGQLALGYGAGIPDAGANGVQRQTRDGNEQRRDGPLKRPIPYEYLRQYGQEYGRSHKGESDGCRTWVFHVADSVLTTPES